MAHQIDLLQEASQKYVLDACAMLDFWGSIPGYKRPYDVNVQSFHDLWDKIANLVSNGVVLIPEVIYKEVDETTVQEFHKWLLSKKRLYVDYDDCMAELGEIVNEFKFYTSNKASLNDAVLVAIAKHRQLTVVTSERKSVPISYKKPMIPNICEFFKVPCMNLPEFLEAEGL
jgi:Domain of unknown function (DUF4411)